MPMTPQQKFVVSVIAAYLEDQVEEPLEVALAVWRITRTELRPITVRNADA